MREKNICIIGGHRCYFSSISITNLKPNGWALNLVVLGEYLVDTRAKSTVAK